MTSKQLEEIIKLASQPLQPSSERLGGQKNEDYTSKRTRSHSPEDISEKQRDKSR